MSDQPCCAHMNVVYKRIDHPGGTSSDRWECRDCHAEFKRTIWETLRDKFARSALTGLSKAWLEGAGGEDYRTGDLAEDAYEIADAMMKAREGK